MYGQVLGSFVPLALAEALGIRRCVGKAKGHTDPVPGILRQCSTREVPYPFIGTFGKWRTCRAGCKS